MGKGRADLAAALALLVPQILACLVSSNAQQSCRQFTTQYKFILVPIGRVQIGGAAWQ